jgi:hypothetical protein
VNALFLYLALIAGLMSSTAFGQGTNQTRSVPSFPTPPPALPQKPPLIIPGPRLFFTNRPAMGPFTFNLNTNSPSALPKPGVYRTEPFACIVVVPGAQHDDACIIGSTNRHGGLAVEPKLNMPTMNPPLRFIPLNGNQR